MNLGQSFRLKRKKRCWNISKHFSHHIAHFQIHIIFLSYIPGFIALPPACDEPFSSSSKLALFAVHQNLREKPWRSGRGGKRGVIFLFRILFSYDVMHESPMDIPLLSHARARATSVQDVWLRALCLELGA
jgi:hypothetical protein